MEIGRPVRAKVLDGFFLSEDAPGGENISQRCQKVKLAMEASVEQIEARILIDSHNEQADMHLIVRMIQDNISSDCQ
jgi:hypothetical protein